MSFPFALFFFLKAVRIRGSYFQSLPPICGLYKKPFRGLRTLCVKAQLVVTAEVKRCFRSQRAIQPSSTSTKYCLCWGYFQTSCAGGLLRRRAFPPRTVSPRCSPKFTCMVKLYFNDYKNCDKLQQCFFLKDHSNLSYMTCLSTTFCSFWGEVFSVNHMFFCFFAKSRRFLPQPVSCKFMDARQMIGACQITSLLAQSSRYLSNCIFASRLLFLSGSTLFL